MLRITAAQLNPTIGDMQGNIALMLDAARIAHDQCAALVVFPEMSLTAYYPGDLLDDARWVRLFSATKKVLKNKVNSLIGAR